MTKPIAWSYSRLTNYEQCPKKFWHLSVQKDFKEPESEAMRYGNQVHKALEERVSKNVPLPAHLTHLEPVAAKFANAPGEKYAELQLAVDENFAPTTWFARNVWARAIIDLAIVNGDKALIVDWKTGKMSDDFTQQQVAACMFMIYYPQVVSMDLMYYWIKDKKPTVRTLTREDTNNVWSPVMRRVRKYVAAHEQTDFPPRPSGLCKKHCPITTCVYHGGN
jgi:hypothetical protein